MSGLPSVDALVSDLRRVLSANGISVPGPPKDARALEKLEAAIAPAVLPAGVRRLWELIDAGSLDRCIDVYPGLTTPKFALASWKQSRREPFGGPKHFVCLCYTSHDLLSVECDGPGWTGGALFESFISDPNFPFTLMYRSVEDWLVVLIAVLEAGAFALRDGKACVDDARHRQLAAEKLASYGPDPVYGTRTELSTDIYEWHGVARA